MRLAPFVAILAIALVPAVATATTQTSAVPASGGAMSLSDAVAYATDHSATVVAQRANVANAQHAVALQRGVAYPTVNGTLQSFLSKSGNYEGGYAVIGATQQASVSQNTAALGINNWNVNIGGLSFIQLAGARAQERQAENTLANTEDGIAASVTNGFYAIAQRKAVVLVDIANQKYQDVLVQVAKAQEKAGVAAGVDVLQAKTAQAKNRSVLVADRAAVADASQALAQQIGAPLLTAFAVPVAVPQPPIPHGSVDALVAIAEVNRPDVAAAHEAVLAAAATRHGWNVELAPTISLSANLGNQYSPTSAGPEQEQQDLFCATHVPPIVPCPTVPRGSPGFWSLQAVSTFSLPLVDYNARHSERVNDDVQLASAKASFAQTRLQAELDVRTSYRAAQTALAQLGFAREEASYGTEAARIAQLQYKTGVKTIYDVLQAQQNAVSAQNDLVTARVNYVEAVVKLRVSLGTYTAASAVADLN